MKMTKKILTALLFIALISCCVMIPVNASTYIGSVTKKEGGFLWFGGEEYTYKCYFDNEISRVFQDHPLCNTMHHTYQDFSQYNNRYVDFTMAIQTDTTIQYSTTVSYNQAMNAGVVLDQIIELSAQHGYGVTFGVSYSETRSSAITKYIYSDFPTGYYLMLPAQNEKKCHWDKYYSNGTYLNISGDYYMPYGTSYTQLVYSLTSDLPSYYFAP